MFKFEFVLATAIILIMALFIVAIATQPPVEPYTLVIIDLATKEEVIRIEDVISDFELVFKCKDNASQFQEIIIPDDIMPLIKKIEQTKEKDVWGTTR